MQNFPTVGLIDGNFRANLEETGMSYALEIDMIAKAREKDMLTTPYVFSEAEAAAMAIAGADIIVCHLGLTTGGSIGAQTALEAGRLPGAYRHLGRGGAERQFEDSRARAWRSDRDPADADFIIRNTRNCHGFYGASSMERLPVELALTDQVRKFKAIGAR